MPLEYKNCSEHRWPTSSPGTTTRSVGRVDYEQCNDCLAYRICFSTHVLGPDNTPILLQETQIVEPRFGTGKSWYIVEVYRNGEWYPATTKAFSSPLAAYDWTKLHDPLGMMLYRTVAVS